MRIDWWTLALQTVNVLVLIWILGRFFFRPIMGIVAERQEKVQKLLADAALARQQAADEQAEAEKARAQTAAEREGAVAEARTAANAEREDLIAKASREIAHLRTEAAAAIASDRTAAEAAIIDRACELSIEVARRLLVRFPHQEILFAFVDQVCGELRNPSSPGRQALAADALTGRPLTVVTAVPLTEQEKQHISSALGQAFGRELPFGFRSDPGIIAGIELHGQSAIIRNSWRADLDRIRQELNRDNHIPKS
jgi:F-type H+-transporting ATPase subunit b